MTMTAPALDAERDALVRVGELLADVLLQLAVRVAGFDQVGAARARRLAGSLGRRDVTVVVRWAQ